MAKTYFGEEAQRVSAAVVERNLRAIRESKDLSEFFVPAPKALREGSKVSTPSGRATVLATEGYNGLVLVRHANGATWLWKVEELS